MKRLGVEVEYTSRPQTKGKVEKVIQFIERDFWRWSATGSRVWMILTPVLTDGGVGTMGGCTRASEPRRKVGTVPLPIG